MKRIGIVAFLLATQITFSEGFNVKLGYNTTQTVDSTMTTDNGYSLAGSSNIDLDNNFSIDLSYDFTIRANVEIGVGANLLTTDLEADSGSLDYDLIPVYGEVKYKFSFFQDGNLYLIEKLGYTIADSNEKNIDTNGGLYIGSGFGIEGKKLSAELIWESLEYETDIDYDYGKIHSTSILQRLKLMIGFNMNNFKKYPIINSHEQSRSNPAKELTLLQLKEEGLITEEQYSNSIKSIIKAKDFYKDNSVKEKFKKLKNLRENNELTEDEYNEEVELLLKKFVK